MSLIPEELRRSWTSWSSCWHHLAAQPCTPCAQTDPRQRRQCRSEESRKPVCRNSADHRRLGDERLWSVLAPWSFSCPLGAENQGEVNPWQRPCTRPWWQPLPASLWPYIRRHPRQWISIRWCQETRSQSRERCWSWCLMLNKKISLAL